jgi:hypothetical protein
MTSSRPAMWKWAAMWGLPLVAAALAASALTFAQTRFENAPIVSGSDIGFRIEGRKDGAPLGTLMVRLEGRWVEAGWNPRAVPAK